VALWELVALVRERRTNGKYLYRYEEAGLVGPDLALNGIVPRFAPSQFVFYLVPVLSEDAC
jgi:hypothetical protein